MTLEVSVAAIATRLLAAGLLAVCGASWAADRCAQSADEQFAVWAKLSGSTPLSSGGFEAEFQIDNRGRSDVWIDVFEDEGKRVIGEAQVLFQFPDVNGQWVTWVTPPGSYVGRMDPTRLRAGASERVHVWLPPNELFMKFHGKARMLFRLAKSRTCVASIPFEAVVEGGHVAAFRSGSMAGQDAHCAEVRPPEEAAVNLSHGTYLFVHPKTLGEAYSGCQTMWNEQGKIIFVLSFQSGKLMRMRAWENAGASKPLECLYRDRALVKGDPDACPDYEALAGGFRTVGAEALEVPENRDPRARRENFKR